MAEDYSNQTERDIVLRYMNSGGNPLGIAGALRKEREGGNLAPRLEQALMDLRRAQAEAGMSVLPEVVSGTTAQGFDSALGSILNNSGAITGARTGAASDYMARAGLSNPAAASAAGKMSSADTVAIEDELSRRRQALLGIGTTGMGVQSDMMNAAGIRGKNQALMRAQQRAQNKTNNMNMLGGLIGGMGSVDFGSMFGGGAGAAGSNISDYTGSAYANWINR